MQISDSELMAEKLGMIVLCENCGKRLYRRYVARIGCWKHEENDSFWCTEKGEFKACARSGPLADQYRMEPQ